MRRRRYSGLLLALALTACAPAEAAVIAGPSSAPVAPPRAVTYVAPPAPVPGPPVRVGPTAAPRPPAPSVPVPRASGTGRRIVYALAAQRVWLVRADGSVQRTHLVSGQARQPAPGSYRVYSKSRTTSSPAYGVRMQYMVRFTYGRYTGTPVGFHDIPVDSRGRLIQSLGDLGRPVSHGCVRQRRTDAAALWAFAPVGTRVVVVR